MWSQKSPESQKLHPPPTPIRTSIQARCSHDSLTRKRTLPAGTQLWARSARVVEIQQESENAHQERASGDAETQSPLSQMVPLFTCLSFVQVFPFRGVFSYSVDAQNCLRSNRSPSECSLVTRKMQIDQITCYWEILFSVLTSPLVFSLSLTITAIGINLR